MKRDANHRRPHPTIGLQMKAPATRTETLSFDNAFPRLEKQPPSPTTANATPYIRLMSYKSTQAARLASTRLQVLSLIRQLQRLRTAYPNAAGAGVDEGSGVGPRRQASAEAPERIGT